MKRRIFATRMWLILLLALLVFGGVFAMQWYSGKMTNAMLDNMPRPTVTITASAAHLENWQPRIDTVGTFVAIHGAQLSAEVSGIVTRIHFANGSEVEAGDVIAELDLAPDRAELKALQAAQELAAIEMRRAANLLTQRNISKSELDRRESELDQSRANVEAQQARIEQKQLRAPFSGRLGIRQFNVGDYLVAGATFIDLQSLEKLYLNFTLPEQFSRQVATGLPVEARLEAFGEQVFHGELTAIAPSVNAQTRNFALQATLANPQQVLRPGMFARLSIPLGQEREQLLVPQTAVAYRPYGNSVYVVVSEDGQRRVVQRFVTLGA
ncbi:MAG: efflux RND transporter periplasmic adaptor subunit, partial [Halioglobus sp.]|nr:efflux RND transporter periplasmic adaptor subunit [Halioglobus sp.]